MENHETYKKISDILTDMSYAAAAMNVATFLKHKHRAQDLLSKVFVRGYPAEGPFDLANKTLECFENYVNRDYSGNKMNTFVAGSKYLIQLDELLAESVE